MTHNGRDLNTGNICTGQSCRGCNKCIAVCPSFGANVAIMENGQNRIYVDANECLGCGKCLEACPHDARIFFDDMTKMLEGLAAYRSGNRKRPISIVVDPSFEVNYPDKYANVLGWLKSLGAQHIYSSGLGADIFAWASIKHFEKSGARGLISSYCPIVADYVERNRPDAVESLMPVMSPLMCTAVYLRKHMHMETDIAFIAPCVARASEVARPENRTYVQYIVTFERLIEAAGMPDPELYSTAMGDATPGSLSCMRGGVREIIERYIGLDTENYVVQPGGANHAKNFIDGWTGGGDELFTDIRGCDSGCIYGPCTGNADTAAVRRRESAARALLSQRPPGETAQSALETLNERFEGFDYTDFLTTFRAKPPSLPEPSKAQVDDAFQAMVKHTREEQSVNCTSCGYDSCKHMARAIALGINHPVNCSDYTRRLLSVERSRADMLNRRLTRLESGVAVKSTSGIDPLTGLGSRFVFEQYMETVLTRSRETGSAGYVFSIDLDDFATVNESYGHSFGNALLVEFTRFLKETLGGLCEVFRTDGDEFTLVAEGADATTAKYISDALIGRGQGVWKIMNAGIYCTVSVGVVHFPEFANCVSDIVKYVELATNTAKGYGKNRCVSFTPNMKRDTQAQAKIARQMREAISNDFERFEVYYQPWVTCVGDVVGAEALLRWRGEDGQLLHPSEFIDVAELSGLIVTLDEFVLRQAAQKAKEILEKCPNFLMSVNLSERRFSRTDMVQSTLDIIDAAGIPRGSIILEITEPGDADFLERYKDTFNALSRAGVKIALDDLNSGYGSLGFLSELPINLVKLSRSFISSALNDNHVKYLFTTTIDLMHKMGRQVCVKGVEARVQLNFCESVGADIVQGFLFFNPMPGPQLTQLTHLTHLTQTPR